MYLFIIFWHMFFWVVVQMAMASANLFVALLKLILCMRKWFIAIPLWITHTGKMLSNKIATCYDLLDEQFEYFFYWSSREYLSHCRHLPPKKNKRKQTTKINNKIDCYCVLDMNTHSLRALAGVTVLYLCFITVDGGILNLYEHCAKI